jgi:hypothetical protein
MYRSMTRAAMTYIIGGSRMHKASILNDKKRIASKSYKDWMLFLLLFIVTGFTGFIG